MNKNKMTTICERKAGIQVLLNCRSIKSGGGLQKTLGFLDVIGSRLSERDRFGVYCPRDGAIEKMCKERRIPHVACGGDLRSRYSEHSELRKWSHSAAVVFNVGGVAIGGMPGHIVQVGECAYSNLLYPEIDFWRFRRGFDRARSELVDCMRRRGIEKNDVWLFQTDILRDRAISLANFPADRVFTVGVCASSLVRPSLVSSVEQEGYRKTIGSDRSILLLAGPNENKRLHLIPEIASVMAKIGDRATRFVFTLDHRCRYWGEIEGAFARLGVRDMAINLGPVPQQHVGSAVSAVRLVANISVLESFSNCFIEAWTLGKPLVATDADWARAAAGNAAAYIDPENSIQAARVLGRLLENRPDREKLVEMGTRKLADYHTPESKAARYCELFDRAIALGKRQRIAIRWPLPIHRRWW